MNLYDWLKENRAELEEELGPIQRIVFPHGNPAEARQALIVTETGLFLARKQYLDLPPTIEDYGEEADI